MNKQAVLAILFLPTAVAWDAAAGCGPPSLQIQRDASTGFATAVVTFVKINGRGANATVAGCTLSRNSGSISDSDAAAAFEELLAPSNGSFDCANYSGWEVSSDQTGLTAPSTQVRYVSTVPSTVEPIPVGGSQSHEPSEETTQGDPVPAMIDLLTNNTVCVGNGAPWDNQEWHQAGGNLWDWKRGDGHESPSGTVDPTKQIGTWAINGGDAATTVDYTYGSAGPSYSFGVWKNIDADGTGQHTYSFCQGTNELALGRIFEGEISCTAGGTRL